MSDDALKYDRMVETALRGVVREALTLTAEHGLPGNHHFYITFRTDHPGVSLADYLRERFPGEMTIVLQLQFWGLKVEDDRFEVTLSFNDKPERLCIPFAAVTAFADPSVRFGLQFEAGQESADPEDLGAEPAEDSAESGDTAKPTGTALAAVPAETGPGAAESKPAAAKPPGKPGGEPAAGQGKPESGKQPDKADAEVVSLDAFRKK
jgi:hypothetical protein